jgi:hypothetical protein
MHQRAASTKRGFGVIRRPLLALAIVLAGQTWMRPAGAQEIEVLLPHKEAQVKCALLYSFSLMIGWPESAFADAKSPFVIGVLGDRPHLHYLDRVVATKKEIRGRPLVVRRFGNVAEIRD